MVTEGRKTVTGCLGRGSRTEWNAKGRARRESGKRQQNEGGRGRPKKGRKERLAGDLVKRGCLIGLLQRACSLMGPV